MAVAGEASVVEIGAIRPLGHREAMALADAEFARTTELLRQLNAEDWQRPTVCPEWDARAIVAHVVGMTEAQASFRQFAHDFWAARHRSGGAMIDAMTATQVRERAHLSPAELVEALARAAPRAVVARRRTPALLRWGVRMRQDPPFDGERWKYGYLVDVIFTRDTWMHRLDICRATGRDMVVTAGHDGRIVDDVVSEWARRHGQPFSLDLAGPAGGRWKAGEGGDLLEFDALEFCWTVAGRGSRAVPLGTPVPF